MRKLKKENYANRFLIKIQKQFSRGELYEKNFYAYFDRAFFACFVEL